MKKFFLISLTIIVAAFFLNSCAGEEEVKPVKADGYEVYKDKKTGFSVKYPKNWVTWPDEPRSRFIVFSDEKVKKERLFQLQSMDDETLVRVEAYPAAKIDVYTIPLQDSVSFGDIVDQKAYENVYEAPVNFAKGDTGVSQKYSFPYGTGQIFEGEIFYALNDSMVTIISFETMGTSFKDYKPVFDEVIASLELAARPIAKTGPDTITQEIEQDPPSKTLKTVSGDGYTIQIPDNFNLEKGYYLGMRRGDSYVRVDADKAPKNINLEKTAKESMKKFKGAKGMEKISLGGLEAYRFSYTPQNGVSGVAFMTTKGEKLYQITVNWFDGEAADYKDILLKSAMTFKAK